MRRPLRIAVIGYGLIGKRRAREAARHPLTTLDVVASTTPEHRAEVRGTYGCRVVDHWKHVLEGSPLDAVVVATPNGYLREIGIAALEAGMHVLIEKPPDRNVQEALDLAEAAKKAGKVLKVGFNHRYHPALTKARRLLSEGRIGNIINIRARYGHGGRPGYEKEWRGNPEMAGGGELTDQGVHIADLTHWFAGLPAEAVGMIQTAVWPIHPLEDNGFGLFRFRNGSLASLHTSWTQWKNLFSFEVFGELGSLTVEGLGGSYGVERLITAVRKPEGGLPSVEEEQFEGPDASWEREWADFVQAITEGRSYWGTPDEGVAAMTMIDALYRSARSGTVVRIAEGSGS